MNAVIVALLLGLFLGNALGDHHGEGDDTTDPHNICTDISYYSDVKYKNVTRYCENKKFVKKCEDKWETVCMKVKDMVCETKAWAECSMEMTDVKGSKCDCEHKIYDKIECEEYLVPTYHPKKDYKCVNVTKLNCVTTWDTLEDGRKVWDGKEQCEPIVWKNCTLVDVEVEFNETRTKCTAEDWIPYLDYKNVTTDETNMSLTCEVKKSVDCVPVEKESCVNVEYQECHMVPDVEITRKEIPTPYQLKVHQKKCLVPDV